MCITGGWNIIKCNNIYLPVDKIVGIESSTSNTGCKINIYTSTVTGTMSFDTEKEAEEFIVSIFGNWPK